MTQSIEIFGRKDIEEILSRSKTKEYLFIYKEMNKLREDIFMLKEQLIALDKKLEMKNE